MECVEELNSLDLSRCAWACVVLEVRCLGESGRLDDSDPSGEKTHLFGWC